MNINIVHWGLSTPEGSSIYCGKILYSNEYSYTEFASELSHCKGLSQIQGIRCNILSFTCDDKNIGLLTIRDLKNKLGDSFPIYFYFNGDMVWRENINSNKLLRKIGNWYKKFTL